MATLLGVRVVEVDNMLVATAELERVDSINRLSTDQVLAVAVLNVARLGHCACFRINRKQWTCLACVSVNSISILTTCCQLNAEVVPA